MFCIKHIKNNFNWNFHRTFQLPVCRLFVNVAGSEEFQYAKCINEGVSHWKESVLNYKIYLRTNMAVQAK